MSTIRPAAVAGTFYPRDARALGAEVDDLLGNVEELAPRLGFPKALVVPHAGYIYSGPVAARAFDELAPARGIVRRVVLLGPVHRVPVRGLAVPGADAFETPLGRVAVDRPALRALEDLPQIVRSDPAHALEHSLEVQLPFLQKVLGGFTLAPFAVGTASVAEVAQVLERLWGGEETLIVVSTDLSHYHDYERARAVDARTLARIAACASDLDHEEACGATPLNGLLAVAGRRGLPVRLLAACNSGDTAGSRERVVGYSSFALYERAVSLADAGGVLLSLAHACIEDALFDRQTACPRPPWLRQSGATFVTLKKDGELRGCIGSLQALRPLADDIAQNALAAAFGDPRFAPLALAEWPQCSLEVSLLSTPKPLRFADEEDLLGQLSPGEDGVIVELDGRRATFLPQVWESLPERRAFMAELLRKAGLAADTRLARCKVSRYRVARFHAR